MTAAVCLVLALVGVDLGSCLAFDAPPPAAREPEPAREPLESCVASWYGEPFRGLPTASGVAFDPDGMTAAHRELELGTTVEVVAGDRSVVVEVNDRGPFADVSSRCIDLSAAAFAVLEEPGAGLVDVVIYPAPSGDA